VSALLIALWLSAVDAGTSAARQLLSPEDAEVLKNLELLESLDEARDLELLQELAVER
jgi:hypothetical protein